MLKKVTVIIINYEPNDAIRKYRYKSWNIHWLVHDI